MVKLQPTQTQNPRSFWELLHSEIKAIAHRVTVAVSSFFSVSIVSKSLCQLKDRVITLLPEKVAIKLDPRRMLIRVIREMPPDKRVDFTCSMLELISPQIDLNFKDAKIVVANLGNDEGQLVRDILPFIPTEMYSPKNIEIIQKITDIPVNERIEIIKASNLLITPEMTTCGKVEIIRKVASIPADDRINAIKATNLLIPSKKELIFYHGIDEIIQEVANVPANEREEVIKSSEPLITPEMSANEIALIIREVANIPANEREAVIESSQLLVTLKMSADETAEIIEAIADIPVNEREEVIKSSQLLITQEMSAGKIASIIRAIANIPVNQREEAIRRSQLLVTPEMEEHAIAAIIWAVANTPVNQREEVIRRSQLLVTPEMSADTLAVIIWAVANIPVNQREDVIKRSQLLVTPEMQEYAIAEIIWAVANIPANEREDVIGRSKLLITPEMSAGKIAAIIQAVTNIPVNEREDVIRYSQMLITPEKQEYEIALIIRAVANIPANERARIIPIIAALPVNEREEAIRNAAFPLLRRRMNVHANDRDQRTKAAIELLLEHQKHIQKFEINEAKDDFIAYLEKSTIDETKKTLAKRALLEPRKNTLDFGPLITDEGFTILGSSISGVELIGHLWIFISHLDKEEQTNATTSMISALIDSYSDPHVRVCNQGKTQRLIVAVLQGRLAGVNIEGDVVSVSTSEAMSMFFNIEAHQKIDTLKDLMEAANQFCDEHTLVDRDSFILDLEEYARLEGMEN